MSFFEEPTPRFSFTATPVTELDIEALLDMWDDPSPVVGFSLPPLKEAEEAYAPYPPYRNEIPLSPTESTLTPSSLSPSPSPPRIPRSHSLLNLRSAARGSISSSSAASESAPTDSSAPSPPFPTTPTFPSAHPTALFPTTASSSKAKADPPSHPQPHPHPHPHPYLDLKPLPPVRPRPSSALPPSPSATEDLLGLEDLFGPPRANPFPTVSRSGSACSGGSPFPSSPSTSASPFPFPSTTPRRGSALSNSSTSSSSNYSATPTRPASSSTATATLQRAATFASRLERFEAPLPLPRAPATTAFDPSQGGKAAFTAPRAAPAPAGALPGALPPLDAAEAMQQYPRVAGEVLRERQVAVYPRPRPEKEKKADKKERAKREREASAGSTASSASGSASGSGSVGGGMLSRWR
ncbi:hypothetical protein JCM6882_008052 [Rhodosporidiobolus microsporus]